jgi:tetratricopeptide (TPR) repeat protein/sugar lactone lactonase YvrE
MKGVYDLMNKTKLTRIILLTVCLIVLSSSFLTASALVPYTTFTYSVDGLMQESPHAYVPLMSINSNTIKDSYLNNVSDLVKERFEYTDIPDFQSIKDVFVDDQNFVYLVDSKVNCVVVLDEKYNFRLKIDKFINNQGIPDSLSGPEGVFVTDKEIYVADKLKSRIVIFDKVGNFVDIVPEPKSDVFPEGHIYKPKAVAVDRAGRLYVVSETTNYGVISLNRDGSFNNFVGPQKVTYSAWQIFLRMFKTEEQLRQEVQYVPTEYNNLTIDADGFVYVTTDSVNENSMRSAINGKSKSGDYAPVKRFNPNGKDVMNRNGLWPPSGEVAALKARTDQPVTIEGVSKIVDVALGPNGCWSIIDNKRSRVFTYDHDGNLLYGFCDIGDQNGNIQNLTGIAYQGSNILLLDATTNAITVYKRTAYGDLIDSAIKNTMDKNYEKAVIYYTGILQKNNNYDSAYVGIGESLYRDGDYLGAMKYFRYAYDRENYSEAYSAYRKNWIEDNVWVVPIVIIAVCVGLSEFFKFARKFNKKGQKSVEKRTFASEIMYAFHVMFHPFDGFWDLKHEKRGSVRGATFWLGITCLVYIYETIGQGYLYNQYVSTDYSFLMIIITVCLPFMLFAIANWCLTTLFEGEGSFKDVYIATCYSIVPLPLIMFPKILLTNIVTMDEMSILSTMISMAWIWVGFLIFFAMMVTHDYTLGKNIITMAGTIIGAAFIMFIGVLFSSLIMRVVTFFYNIYVELKYRYW